MRFLLLTLPIWYLRAGEVFFAPGEVHYDHDEINQRYQAGDKAALLELKELCYKDSTFNFYSCYLAARLTAEAGERKSSDEFLKRALSIKPDFTEALNFAIQQQSPALFLGDPALVHFALAAQAARQKKVNLALTHMSKAISHGAKERMWYEGHPDFQNLKKNKHFQNLLNSLLQTTERSELVKRMLKSRDSDLFLDPAYTLEHHRSQPDSRQLLYHYYEAYEKIHELTNALEHLKIFLANLEKLEPQKQILTAYAVVYLWQQEHFRSLRHHKEAVSLLKNYGRRYGIAEAFFQ